MEPERTLLVTGWPGFIGRRLVERLLADDPAARVVALTEARFAATPAHERVEVVAGDVGDRRLGLSREMYGRLARTVTEVFHLAAIYDLAVPRELAQRVNVDGTGNVVDFCAAAERLVRHNYVSTAYVAGDRRGVVYEHELTEGQGFKNHYEATKYQAEVWVHGSMSAVPTTIDRPAIVVGDSRTGETAKFDGPYYLLRLISRMGRAGLPVPNLGRADAPFNVVPVDFVVDAMVAVSRAPDATGKTFHLVDAEPVSARELMMLLAAAYDGARPRGRVPSLLVETALRSTAVRAAFGGTPRESIRYLNHPVHVDARQATDVLGAHGLCCPRLTDYVEPVVAYFKAHER